MQVHIFDRPGTLDQTHWRFICSDLHIESPNFDQKRLIRDFDAARRVGARILINGDIVDAIAPSDKRWTPTCVRKEIRGKDDIFDATIKYVVSVLEPYADLIDVIGIGNHENTWIKWHKSDPVGAVIAQLNRSLATQGCNHKIRHGGVAGYIVSRFPITNSHKRAYHKLLYYHGAGGESPVTKGTIDVARKATNFEFDAVTFGHKHNRLFVDDVVLCVSPTGNVRYKETKAIPTGSYVRNWKLTRQEAPLAVNYSEHFAAPPKPMGGMFLALIPEWSNQYHRTPDRKRSGSMPVIRQEVCTYPVL